jgi:hypothetical protein
MIIIPVKVKIINSGIAHNGLVLLLNAITESSFMAINVGIREPNKYIRSAKTANKNIKQKKYIVLSREDSGIRLTLLLNFLLKLPIFSPFEIIPTNSVGIQNSDGVSSYVSISLQS